MIAVDTSIVVAAFASWHEAHRSAAAIWEHDPRVPAHVLFETYSVLTRLPPPHRADPRLVSAFLGQRFAEAPLVLAGRAQAELIQRAAEAGLAGGSIYDALIAATVHRAGGKLVTRDRRAVSSYDWVGVRYELLV